MTEIQIQELLKDCFPEKQIISIRPFSNLMNTVGNEITPVHKFVYFGSLLVPIDSDVEIWIPNDFQNESRLITIPAGTFINTIFLNGIGSQLCQFIGYKIQLS